MKVVALAEDGRVELQERQLQAPAPGLFRVEVGASGVCSSDLPRIFGGRSHRYPLVPGHEIAGTLVEVPPDAASSVLRPGQRVTVFPLLPCFACPSCRAELHALCERYDYLGSRRDGGFAQYVDVPAWNLLPVPADVGLEDAALCEPAAVVLHALDRLGLTSGDRRGPGCGGAPSEAGPGLPAGELDVAIVGDGFLGLLAARLTARFSGGSRVTVLGRHDAHLSRARGDGAATVGREEAPAWLAANRGRFPFVLVAAGGPEALRTSLELACALGRVVWMGNPEGSVELTRALLDRIVRKELAITGTWNSRYRGAAPSDWTHALELMGSGLAPSSLVTDRTDLDGLPALLGRMRDRAAQGDRRVLKALVIP